ncbi:MAG TPA: alkaline phosphatase family protein [Pirellulaceae bacterium]|jgi:predicted AlkP superfamily pyrophosphatase or phosphodiesterase
MRWLVGFVIGLMALSSSVAAADRPKLIVCVSVDQLCQDYLVRFADNFASDGFFRRIEREGAAYTDCNHRHAFTVTGPGHAVQLTGTYPSRHGIVGNNWFDRTIGKDVYCCDDASVQLLGLPAAKGISPKNLLVETTGDKMRLSTNNRSKVFGVAIKDRASVLMTGKNADTAFWMEDNLWTTSTYYRTDMPGYLRVLNESQSLEKFRGKKWELLLAKDKYHNSGPDQNKWENPPKGFTSEFPHQLPEAGKMTPLDFGELVLFSPFGNDATLEAARAIVEGEQLGSDEFPDLLCMNFSSNDYVGHAFGPHSLEVEDITYRTDRQLGEFLRWLDEKIGANKWTLLLTADHGVAPIVEYAQQFRLPAKRIPLGKADEVKTKLEKHLREQLGLTAAMKPLVQKAEDYQVYLQADHDAFAKPGTFAAAQRLVRDWLLDQPYVAGAFTRDELATGGSGPLFDQVQRTFLAQRSGDVLFATAPYTVPGAKGTTHGSPWHYDTHVPLLAIGCGIKNGRFTRPVSPPCVASTVAELAGVDYPSANSERPLAEALGQ